MNMTVGFYARVSSQKQAQAHTIDSQVAALEARIAGDGYALLPDKRFIDDGYSGSQLIRPALERLRDSVAAGEIDKVYIHSPDRLARKYAYQMLLLEEFQRGGIDIIFLNCDSNESPESSLLLQMQGMIAEYERAKIMERHRRGKLHAAKRGSINVLGTAPYGYRYHDKYTSNGEALFTLHEEEAPVVKQIFAWAVLERCSIGEICRRLNQHYPLTRKGKTYWDRSVIWGILKNPAYKGQAAFGKTKLGKPLPSIRPQKHSQEHKRAYSIYPVDKAEWIYIPVPAIVEEAVFDAVQAQLAENRKQARTRKRGARYLLQGLLVCQQCHYAFYGKPVRNKRGEKIDSYAYYQCIGGDAYRFGGHRLCHNLRLRTDTLETAVWSEITQLLQQPERLLAEFERRLAELESASQEPLVQSLEKQQAKLQRGIARLIDSYAQETIDKAEFVPRVKAMKERLKLLEQEQQKRLSQQQLKAELLSAIANLEQFSAQVTDKLKSLDWLGKREIIRTLVKRIEINQEDINIVFRINNLRPSKDDGKSLQHCWRGNDTALRCANPTFAHFYFSIVLFSLHRRF